MSLTFQRSSGLMHKADMLGYHPQVILAGRRINDGMPAWIAKKLVQLLIQKDKSPGKAKVLVLGITFKEDVADIRDDLSAALSAQVPEVAR